jgi:hypothetical protein
MGRQAARGAFAIVLIASGLALPAQPQPLPADDPTFEVASIKPYQGRGAIAGFSLGPREVRLPGTTFERQLRAAHNHPNPYEIRGAPGW